MLNRCTNLLAHEVSLPSTRLVSFSGVAGEGSEDVLLCRIVRGGGRIFLVAASADKVGLLLTGGSGGGKLGAEKQIQFFE